MHAFGQVINGHMILSWLGRVAWACWFAIPEHFPFVRLDEFVVMPDHVHGIIIIDKPIDDNGAGNAVGNDGDNRDNDRIGDRPVGTSPRAHHADINHPADTQSNSQLRDSASIRRANHFGPQSCNLASIVRGFKIGVTNAARRNGITFAWQPRFYDHIVRDEADCERIRRYIANNPKTWGEKRFRRH